MNFTSPANATYWLVQGKVLFTVLYLVGTICFLWIAAKRIQPLVEAQRDPRFHRPWPRLGNLLQYWLGQWRHPRYPVAGAVHIMIFAGFLILAWRAFALLIFGVSGNFVMPGGRIYGVLRDYAATVVLFAVAFAVIRRILFRPQRYRSPEGSPVRRSADPVFLLALIGGLMVADALFEGAKAAALGGSLPAGSLGWMATHLLKAVSVPVLRKVYLGAYLAHGGLFFFLLCYRPFGIQFHVETSLFSIWFAKLDRASLKPVRWGTAGEENLDDVTSFGVKTFHDFTWKHILDFYSCADCGRCSDQCPANAVGRAMSPRIFSTKARDYAFQHYPVLGRSSNGTRLAGTVFSEEEIWACTTCGACERECPLLVEYIDKIVDLRRGLMDDGKAPQSLHKPLKSLENRGNPFGKLEKKRADWAGGHTQVLESGHSPVDTLYFVDSVTSYDERVQRIARATSHLLSESGVDFGILGPAERDSGHDVRRFGEETLFAALRGANTDAIRAAGVRRIVTADPHAFNALKHDYRDVPPVEHATEAILGQLNSGTLHFRPLENRDNVYTFHDPCYLGRHNGVFDAPRDVLDSIPGLKRVEMDRCRDRSFCCGGGGLALFYEAKENERMAVRRVRMAAEAGANVMVTACPFCMLNMEDAIKVAGFEGRMTAIDVMELAESQL